MKFKCLIVIFLISFTTNSYAKVWRVNNTAGVSANFPQLSSAISSPLVQNGDTIYLESSATNYMGTNVNKKVVIIGAGYLLNQNLGLQSSEHSSTVDYIQIDSLASGSSFYGLAVNQFFVNSNADNITISRCYGSLNTNSIFANSKVSGWTINKCFVTGMNFSSPFYVFENLQFTNCIMNGLFTVANTINGLFRNNVFTSNVAASGSYVTNNIFIGSSTLNFTNCTVKYNISQGNNLPAGNNNQNNISQASLFLLTGSSDGRFQLTTGSPAIAAGEPINGETPDCGPFGTADPYRLSGIPPIPTIYQLTVPASIPSSSTSMTITISTRSNN